MLYFPISSKDKWLYLKSSTTNKLHIWEVIAGVFLRGFVCRQTGVRPTIVWLWKGVEFYSDLNVYRFSRTEKKEEKYNTCILIRHLIRRVWECRVFRYGNLLNSFNIEPLRSFQSITIRLVTCDTLGTRRTSFSVATFCIRWTFSYKKFHDKLSSHVMSFVLTPENKIRRPERWSREMEIIQKCVTQININKKKKMRF